MKFTLPARNKYNAKPTHIEGFRYDSKKEAKYSQNLSLLQKAGEVLFFLRQVPFHLSPDCTYRVDFVVFYGNGDVRFIDVKGYETKDFKVKKAWVEQVYPIKIEIV